MAHAAGALRVLHESVVREDEIDDLGHMNVRHYATRALASTDRLLGELGVDAACFGSAGPLAHDLPRMFTRYHREQHTGAALEVHGGLIRIDDACLRIYHELRNPAREELAATFCHDVEFRLPGEPEALVIPRAARKELERSLALRPEHGGPRSIDLDAPPVAPSLEDALATGLAFRKPRRIDAADCDAEGRLPAEARPFYMWGGEPLEVRGKPLGPPVFDLPDGGKMGLASMEARSVMVRQPMAGMRIQSFVANVELARKTNLRRYWVFDLDTQELLLANEVVELALHLGKRRAIEFPPEIRADLEARLRPDLR
ncbi:MAG: thioesterase family protein [Myxococcota bacterium]